MTQRPILATPERLLGRNDSKNPASTCKGFTSAGRPCRRALAVSKLAVQADNEADGVVAVVHEDGKLTDAQYFCWQHKNQVQNARVETLTSRVHKRSTQVFKLKNRSSIDSLMQNLNIKSDERRPVAPNTSVDPEKRNDYRRPSRRAPPATNPSPWRSLCCMLAAEDDDTIEIIRHRRRIEQGRTGTSVALPKTQRPMTTSHSIPASEPQVSIKRDQPLSYIRPGTSPQLAASLLNELGKPTSPNDDEGYIYMFWLTPDAMKPPREETTRSLLSPSTRHERRLSDVMSDFSVPDSNGKGVAASRQKIMVKIGRANNVTRRMNEWQRQCGYELNLIRWYPYVSLSERQPAQPSPERIQSTQPLYPDLSQYGKTITDRRESEGPRKVPCVKRVERLIHIELSNQQVKRQCAACGRDHREWFQVDASEQGVRQVDEVIRRWVEWSQQQ